MINQKAIKEFLERRMDNHDWLKLVKKPELLNDLKTELKKIPNFDKLWIHQLVCFLLVSTLKRFMLHLDMGGGKTSIVLFLILARKVFGQKPKAIVFVPYVTAVDTWIEECRQRTPALKLVPLIGTGIENLRKLEESDGDVFVICYASAVAMLSKDGKTGKRGKRKWVIDPKYTRQVFRNFDTFVADEIHKCSDIGTLTYKMCRAISKQCEYGMGLSGTPFGKNVEDIWSQFYLIDFGQTLGETLGLFRSVFFTQQQNFFSGFPEHKFNKKMMPKLKNLVKNISIHYAASEMHELPARRYIKKKLRVPVEYEGYVTAAATKLFDALKSKDQKVRFQLAEASYMQLRQLASGFMTLNGENDTKIKIAFETNPKLDLLEEIIDSMPHDGKMVIFHHFIFTNQLISDRLKKLKIGHARVWSGQRDVIGELKRFRDDPKCRMLVLNDQSGSNSLNLQNANYMYFFEEPDSSINRQQGERRIWRPGQTKPVHYIDPLMEGTVDSKIYFSNKQGKKLLDELLSGREKL